MVKTSAYLFLILILPVCGVAQEGRAPAQVRHTVSGFVRDSTGEELIGANIFIEDIRAGGVTNAYGFYSLTLPRGSYTLTCSFVGYREFRQRVDLTENRRLDILLDEEKQTLEKVEVRKHSGTAESQYPNMSAYRLQAKNIKEIPSLLGEADLVKTIQMLPGIMAPGEGIAGFIVRGGNYDQNLILLDEAPVYNPTHLLGFFSVFNNDVVKDVQICKGEIPASHGGRLSSLFDIRLREGNRQQFGGSGGIGTISSRLLLEGPVLGKKGSFLLSGRRSYADIFLPLSSNEEVRDNRIYFYDLNLKANYRINEKNRIYYSGYLGNDVFKYQNTYYMAWGNIAQTIRWNHLYSDRLFSNLSLIYSRYHYRLGQTTLLTGVEWNSSVSDIGLKYDFSFFANPRNTIRYGASVHFYSFRPGYIEASGRESVFNDFEIPGSQALEYVIYLTNYQEIIPWIKLEYGLRFSLFQNIGPATVYSFDEQYERIDSTVYAPGTIFHSRPGVEPRISIHFLPGRFSQVTASYNRSLQNLHLISNSTAGTPLDIWIPSNPNIRTQKADQFSLTYMRRPGERFIGFSAGIYYKKMMHQIDYTDHADIILNPELEGELRFGQGIAYGMEYMLERSSGMLTGWISYTLSKAERHFEEINNGMMFPANYDRRHDLSLAGQYQVSDRLKISVNWVYASGSPVTFPSGRFMYGGVVVPEYTERNGYRMPAYHRLDLAAKFQARQKPGRKFRGEWSVSVYNVYNRKNAWMIFFKQNEDNPEVTEAWKLYMFPVIPAISYNFRF